MIRNREQRRKGQTSKSLPCFSASSRATHSSKSVKGAVAMAEGSHTRRGPTTYWTYMLWFREKAASACASPSVPAILGGGMSVREEVPWDDLFPRRALGDAGMWAALVPLLLSLGGGVLIFISIFAGEPETSGTFFAGGAAAFSGLTIAALKYTRGGIVALVLIAVGVFGGWVWEQFRDGASIDAVTYVGRRVRRIALGGQRGQLRGAGSHRHLPARGAQSGRRCHRHCRGDGYRRASERRPVPRGRDRCSPPHRGSRSGATHYAAPEPPRHMHDGDRELGSPRGPTDQPARPLPILLEQLREHRHVGSVEERGDRFGELRGRWEAMLAP